MDDHTLTYTLTYDFPGFLSLLCYLPYEPAYGPLLEEFGDQFCTSAETAYSCGAFYLAEYSPLETWIMKKNPENYDADNVFIETISRIYNAEEPSTARRWSSAARSTGHHQLRHSGQLAGRRHHQGHGLHGASQHQHTYFYIFNFLPLPPTSSPTGRGPAWMPSMSPTIGPRPSTTPTSARAFLYGINNVRHAGCHRAGRLR